MGSFVDAHHPAHLCLLKEASKKGYEAVVNGMDRRRALPWAPRCQAGAAQLARPHMEGGEAEGRGTQGDKRAVDNELYWARG